MHYWPVLLQFSMRPCPIFAKDWHLQAIFKGYKYNQSTDQWHSKLNNWGGGGGGSYAYIQVHRPYENMNIWICASPIIEFATPLPGNRYIFVWLLLVIDTFLWPTKKIECKCSPVRIQIKEMAIMLVANSIKDNEILLSYFLQYGCHPWPASQECP